MGFGCVAQADSSEPFASAFWVAEIEAMFYHFQSNLTFCVRGIHYYNGVVWGYRELRNEYLLCEHQVLNLIPTTM